MRQVSAKMEALLEELETARTEAKKRDKNRCQALARGLVKPYTCSGPIHVHHIVPRSRSRSVYAELSNLVCLCEAHHLGPDGVHQQPAWAESVGLLDYAPGDVVDD